MSDWDKQLNIIFGTLCDGLRQEVRYRSLAQLLAPKEGLSLAGEREAQLKSSFAYYLRLVGFVVHLENYFYREPASRRPDLAVWLPVSKKYLFLEVKKIGPYGGFGAALNDIAKLEKVSSSRDKRNGLIAVGFRNHAGPKERFGLKYERLSQEITRKHPYKKIGVEKIELNGMDKDALYARIGLWVRKFGY